MGGTADPPLYRCKPLPDLFESGEDRPVNGFFYVRDRALKRPPSSTGGEEYKGKPDEALDEAYRYFEVSRHG